MAPTLAVMLGVLLLLCGVAYGFGWVLGRRAEPWREGAWVRMRRWRGREDVVPEGRPIEAIADDLRRLGTRFHALHVHTSFAKHEAVRGAYDRVLAECCACLGQTNLLGVLGPGPELDAERARVERLLKDAGLSLPYTV